MFSKSILSRIYCLFVIICAFLGLGIKTGVFSGGLKLYTLIYFTNQSNLLVILVYSIMLLFKNSRLIDFIYGLALINIIITCAVYFAVLMPDGFYMLGAISKWDYMGNLLLHLAVPVLVFIDFVLGISGRKFFRYVYCVIWSFYLYIYFAFLVIQAYLGGFIPNQNTKYPYNFIAVDLIGWNMAFKNGILLAAVYILLSYAVICINDLLNRYKA